MHCYNLLIQLGTETVYSQTNYHPKANPMKIE